MKYRTFWAICFIAAFGHALSVHSQEVQKDLGLELQLQNKLDQIIAEEDFPGATLAVALDDGTTIDLASGFEDPDSKQKMAIGSRMFCGSTGKTFVSAVALQLVSEGKIRLDDLAIKYFDSESDRQWFARLPNAESITIRSLMNHTSGLPRYLFQEEYLNDLKQNPLRSRTPKEGLSALIGVEPINEVGKGWGYSDSNYLVIGLIIEKVTGKTYYENAQERILDPLKLTHTLPATQPKLVGLIQGHIGSNNMFGLPQKTVADGKYAMDPKFEWCGGGYVTNTRDLATWLAALHSGKVLDENSYAKLVAPVDFRTGQPSQRGYGLGTFVWQSDNGPFLGHAGIMPGYLTQIEYSKDHKFAIALQTNTDQSMGRRLHKHVQDLAELVIKHAKN